MKNISNWMRVKPMRHKHVALLTGRETVRDCQLIPLDIFKCIFMNKNDTILIHISIKFVPKSRIDNKAALALVMACRRTGDKPLPETMQTQFTDVYMRHQGRWLKQIPFGIRHFSVRNSSGVIVKLWTGFILWSIWRQHDPFTELKDES